MIKSKLNIVLLFLKLVCIYFLTHVNLQANIHSCWKECYILTSWHVYHLSRLSFCLHEFFTVSTAPYILLPLHRSLNFLHFRSSYVSPRLSLSLKIQRRSLHFSSNASVFFQILPNNLKLVGKRTYECAPIHSSEVYVYISAKSFARWPTCRYIYIFVWLPVILFFIYSST